MASSSSSSLKAMFLGLFLVALLINSSEARDYLVGGHENYWKIPKSHDGLINWGDKMRLLIGDSIVFKYDPKADSVLQVDEEDYKNCNTTKPLKTFNDGNTKFQFDKSGPFFFISGANGHCEKGEKLSLRVLSPKRGTHAPVSSPATSPVTSPAEAPSMAMPQAPAPAPSDAGNSLKGGVLSLALVLGSIAAAALV